MYHLKTAKIIKNNLIYFYSKCLFPTNTIFNLWIQWEVKNKIKLNWLNELKEYLCFYNIY